MKKLLTLVILFTSTIASAGTLVINSNQSGESSMAGINSYIDGEIRETNKMRTKKTLHNVREYHTPSTMVGKVAKIANCKKLVLTHLVPTKFNENNLKKIVKADFGKNPIIGHDLLKINIWS